MRTLLHLNLGGSSIFRTLWDWLSSFHHHLKFIDAIRTSAIKLMRSSWWKQVVFSGQYSTVLYIFSHCVVRNLLSPITRQQRHHPSNTHLHLYLVDAIFLKLMNGLCSNFVRFLGTMCTYSYCPAILIPRILQPE